jgi:hypothetical protein
MFLVIGERFKVVMEMYGEVNLIAPHFLTMNADVGELLASNSGYFGMGKDLPVLNG